MSANEDKCLIHYEHLVTENANLMPLNRETFQRLLQRKDARINLGGAHVHEKQMNAIPKHFVQDNITFIVRATRSLLKLPQCKLKRLQRRILAMPIYHL